MIKHIVYILIAIIFIFIYFRYIEYRSIYFPMKDIEFLQGSIGLPYEDIYLDTDDGIRLNAWFISVNNSKWTVLFFHGNAGNISHRLEKILILNRLGLDVFIVDYRGYGKSKGRPSEYGLYKDALASYNFLVSEKEISPERIILYGESLGGGVSIDLATKVSVKALITECAFSSIKEVVKTYYLFLPTFFLSSKFDSANKIKRIEIPKLIIHSKNDEIIPFTQSVKLYNLSPEPKKHLILSGSHNTCYLDSNEAYVSGMREFLESL